MVEANSSDDLQTSEKAHVHGTVHMNMNCAAQSSALNTAVELELIIEPPAGLGIDVVVIEGNLSVTVRWDIILLGAQEAEIYCWEDSWSESDNSGDSGRTRVVTT